MAESANGSDANAVFESAAELFALLSTPIRLKIISAVCNGEKNVSELLGEIDTTQPVLGKHREGTRIYYQLRSERVATLCRAVCTQVAIELEGDPTLPVAERLRPHAAR